MVGLGSGSSTFSGQAYGADKYGLVGVYLQRACAVNLVVALAAVATWWFFAEDILRALGQGEDILQVGGSPDPSPWPQEQREPACQWLRGPDLTWRRPALPRRRGCGSICCGLPTHTASAD